MAQPVTRFTGCCQLNLVDTFQQRKKQDMIKDSPMIYLALLLVWVLNTIDTLLSKDWWLSHRESPFTVETALPDEVRQI